MKGVTTYHPLLVVLHWVLAVFIIGALLFGFLLLDPMPNTDPNKLVLLKAHMAGGMLILVLMAVRWIVRIRTAKPNIATTGHPLLDRLAAITHYGFYVLVLLMAGTGFATALIARLNKIVFRASGEPLPSQFEAYPTFVAHSDIAILLLGLIALHVLAALYHRFIRRDDVLRRMLLGRRSS